LGWAALPKPVSEYRRQILRTIRDDTNAYTNCNSDANTYANCDPYCNANRNPHAYSHANRDAHT